ncbi:cdc42 effector protein 3 isoform X2 [Strigops habroptila]|uniref:cdc42 effector protein 3 isoform X2 n=1 Tax=Strigops habroptila TaxID=2489341 RepID=UPI0011CF2B13|nr:cdc42 effector protein 3 isoform X2 [Strigops habroptila]
MPRSTSGSAAGREETPLRPASSRSVCRLPAEPRPRSRESPSAPENRAKTGEKAERASEGGVRCCGLKPAPLAGRGQGFLKFWK